MKFFSVLVALCATFATSNAQCQNMFGKSFYFQEVEQLCESMSQYNDYNEYWQSVYPQWDYDLQSWQDSIGPMAWSASNDGGMTYLEEVVRYVTEYRENYTDFLISTLENTQQHTDWALGNFSFIQADIFLYLFEFDAALKMAQFIVSVRPECGPSDCQSLIQEAVSNTTNYLETGFTNLMNSNGYLYGMTGTQMLDNFINLYQSAISDMYSPMDALEFLDLHYLESTRSLLHKELDNLSHSMMYNINAGILATLTNERAWLLDLLQTADTWQCYENVNQ